MTLQIKIFNKNDFDIIDYFDGIAYKFSKGAPTVMPEDAAHHIFGVDFGTDAEHCNTPEFRAKVFLHLQKRWGWNSVDPQKVADANKLFENMMFVPVEFKLVEKTAKDRDELPPAREPKGRFGRDTFKPRVDESAVIEENKEEVA